MSRSSGRSSTAAAAYRSGTQIIDKQTGEVHNYKNKGSNGVEESKIILPKNAPEELQDRENLWNAAEESENRKNSVVAREVLVALPHELNKEERAEVVDKYSQSLSDRYQTGVDYSIHKPDSNGDNRNYHAHIMMTTRRIDENGFGEKTRELDAYKSTGKLEINNIRQSWEEHANKALEKSGNEQRIDSRSLKDQGIDREPTKHVGVAGTSIDRKGLFSERAQINRDIRDLNQERIETLKELKQLHSERREVEKDVSHLSKASKFTLIDFHKNERIEKAVDHAKLNAESIHTERETKADNYHQGIIQKSENRLNAAQEKVDRASARVNNAWTRSEATRASNELKGATKMRDNAAAWHKETVAKHSTSEGRKLDAEQRGSKQISDIDKAEPQKRFWQSEQKHEAKHSQWRQERAETVDKSNANIERAAPTLAKSEDIAQGKSAYENKISKQVIKERYDVDNSRIKDESKGLHEDVKQKLDSKIEQRNEIRGEISERQAKIEKLQSKLDEAQAKREANTEQIKGKDNTQKIEQPKTETEAKRTPEQQAKADKLQERLDSKSQSKDKSQGEERTKPEKQKTETEAKRTPEQQAKADKLQERLDSAKDKAKESTRSSGKDDGAGY